MFMTIFLIILVFTHLEERLSVWMLFIMAEFLSITSMDFTVSSKMLLPTNTSKLNLSFLSSSLEVLLWVLEDSQHIGVVITEHTGNTYKPVFLVTSTSKSTVFLSLEPIFAVSWILPMKNSVLDGLNWEPFIHLLETITNLNLEIKNHGLSLEQTEELVSWRPVELLFNFVTLS